jgi:hypothetical protein
MLDEYNEGMNQVYLVEYHAFDVHIAHMHCSYTSQKIKLSFPFFLSQ